MIAGALRRATFAGMLVSARPAASLLAGISFAAGALACSEESTPPAVAAEWQVICSQPPINCTPSSNNTVSGFDGERGIQVSCSGDAQDDDLVSLAFSAGDPSRDFRLEVRRALVSRSFRSITNQGCEVILEHRGNVYEGGCGSAPPSEEVPCQIAFPENAEEDQPNLQDGVVRAQVLCVDIPQQVSRQSRAVVLRADATFNPNDPMASELGAPLLFNFCGGV